MGKSSSTKRSLSNQDGLMGGADNVQPSKLPKSMDSRKKQYKGVRMRSWGSWVSEIRAPNQKTRIWLGSYATPEAAARAYDAALLCLKGSSANLNFPNTSSAYFPDTLLSPKSIQRVAAAAANATPATPPSPPPAPPIPSWSPSPSSSWDTHDEFIAPAPPNPSFSSSSPSPSSWDALDDFTASSSADFAPCLAEQHLCSIDPWIDLDALLHSPKYVDHMLNAFAPSGPVSTEECEEEGDIRLWNFC